MNIDIAQLVKICPKTRLSILNELVDSFNNTIGNKYTINTPNRISGFFAQCAHESANFTVMVENLNYSAAGLNLVFKKYFPTYESALPYHRKPQLIGNKVYANRMGNGDKDSGDGYRFRGRGYIQLTGKNNYLAFSTYLGKMLGDTVFYCETPTGALESAAWFWSTNNINVHCDNDDILKMTKAINGGANGLPHRRELYETMKKTFTSG